MNRRYIFVFALAFSMLLAGATPAQGPQEKFATVFGTKIRYLEAGDATKPVVILLHGLGSNADSSWAFTIPALSANYRVIAPDQIGFGKSDKPAMNYRVATYADFLDKFMSELKIDTASLVGNSMGGWVSVLFASKYPAKANKLVLVDAAGYAPPKDFDYSALQRLNPSTRDGVRAMIKQLFFNSSFFLTDTAVDNFIAVRIAAGDGNTVQTLIKSIESGEDYFDAQVRTLKNPTLIMWGKQDGLAPVTEGERLKRDIAGSELIVFDQAGHFPQVEKPADFNKALLEFLAR